MTFALRYKRSDAKGLSLLAEQVKSGQRVEALSLLESAAGAAAAGEPHLFPDATRDEVERFAADFVGLGFDRPAVEEVRGL